MSFNNIVPAKFLSPMEQLAEQTNKNTSRIESIKKWKTKSWLDFCKLVMEQDTRYTLMPLADYRGRASTPFARTNCVFGTMCLRRDGDRTDVYILPLDPQLGVTIDAGSKYGQATIGGFPAKTLVWPVLRIADELERQYSREVIIESNKRGAYVKATPRKGRKKYVRASASSVGNNASNQLPSSTTTD